MTNERSLSVGTTPSRRIAVLAASAAAAMTVFLVAFAYPATHQAPRSLPIAVAGQPAAVAQFDARLGAQDAEAFEVIPVADRAGAAAVVLDRDAYGAVVLGPQGPVELLVASAASPAVAQLLTQLAGGLAADGAVAAPGLPVTDVAPTPADDPRGAGLAAGSLPLTIGGILTGTLMALLVRGARRQLLGVAMAATLAGSVAVAVLHGWLGALDGNVWAEFAAVAGGVAAIAVLLIGMHALLGRAGLVVADLALVLVGNPLSGATSAPELLPTGWSSVGQWMPLGATVDLLRGVSGFEGRGILLPTLALVGWVALGVTLLALGARRPSAGSSQLRSREAAPAPLPTAPAAS